MKHRVIALCGGIGSGKSTVGNILRNCGCAVVDCDQLSRRIADMPSTVQAVRGLLGNEAVTSGALNRPYIRSRIFADDKLLANYNEIFTAAIKRELTKAVETSVAATVFVEIPLINAFDYPWDEVWQVVADDNCRIERVTARDGVTADNVLAIMARQSAPKHVTRTIANNGTLQQLQEEVMRTLQAADVECDACK